MSWLLLEIQSSFFGQQQFSIYFLQIESKITLGLGGVTIVLVSVAASIGIFAFLRVPATLIIIEVIPFLVLAVGVDNIFILVQTQQRLPRQPNESVEEHVGRTMGLVGPSMTLTSLSECCCFFLGELSEFFVWISPKRLQQNSSYSKTEENTENSVKRRK